MKILKIFGICVAVVVAIFGVSIGILAISGGFNPETIGMTSIYFGEDENQKEQKLIIEDDQKLTINYLPSNANDITLATRITGDDCLEVPQYITAGQEFTIKVKKDAQNRNIGGNVLVEFLSENKNSESNLITPCRLQVTVDVPVEDSDLNFNSSLKYISSVDKPNQYILSKNTTSTKFYLYSNKSNIFDINQWSSVENKDIYFSYKEGDDTVYTNINVLNNGDELEGSTSAVDCLYNALEDRYELNFYPSRISSNTITVNAKVHRSYAIQEEFKKQGFDEFENKFLSRSVTSLQNDAEFIDLVNRYNEFLDKYYIKYFALGNTEALTFFADNSANGKVNISINDRVKDNITESLRYVFVSHSIQFYVSNVKLKSFSVSDEILYLDLMDEVAGEYKREEKFYVLNNSLNNQKQGLAHSFRMDFQSAGSSNEEIDAVARQELINSVDIKVLVYDGTGKSTMSEPQESLKKVTFPSNANGPSVLSSLYADLQLEDNTELSANKFNYNSQYLQVIKNPENNKNINDIYWQFNKLVPSKSEDFQIFLMFTLKVSDEDGEKTFFDFAKVCIQENSETNLAGIEKNANLMLSDTMHVYEDVSGVEYALREQALTTNIQTIRQSTNVDGTFKSAFNSLKLFAYLGTEKNGTVNLDDSNSIMTSSLFSSGETKHYYDILKHTLESTNADRLCRFRNLDEEYLVYGKVDNNAEEKTTNFLDSASDSQSIVYAYELDWKDLQALSASNNKVYIFACYVLTDADNNPIDREGCKLLNSEGKAINKRTEVVNKDRKGDEDFFISVNGQTTEVITYITLNDIFFEHYIQVKSLVEKIFYYTELKNDVIVMTKDTNGEYDIPVEYKANELLPRNDNSGILNGHLKLIVGNTYEDILTVLPYDIKDIEGLVLAETEEEKLRLHKKLSNQLLACQSALNSNLEFHFSDIYGTMLMDTTYANATGGSKVEYKINNNNSIAIHPIYLTINAGKQVTSTTNRPVISLSDEYLNSAIYTPSNALVTVEINSVKISDFGDMYVSDGTILDNITVSGTVNGGWAWSTGIYHDNLHQPVIFETNSNKIDADSLIKENSNIVSNLTDGLAYTVDGLEFEYKVLSKKVCPTCHTEYTEDLTIETCTNTMAGTSDPCGATLDSVYINGSATSSIIDITMLDIDYMKKCLIEYLFDLSDYVAEYKKICEVCGAEESNLNLTQCQKINAGSTDPCGGALHINNPNSAEKYLEYINGHYFVCQKCAHAYSSNSGTCTQTLAGGTICGGTLQRTPRIYNVNNIDYSNSSLVSSVTSGDMYVNVHSMIYPNSVVIGKICPTCNTEYEDTTLTTCTHIAEGTTDACGATLSDILGDKSVSVNDYYKFFEGYNNSTLKYQGVDKDGNVYDYIQIKVINQNGKYILPLKAMTESFAFKFDIVWVFGDDLVITKTYEVNATFKAPSFIANGVSLDYDGGSEVGCSIIAGMVNAKYDTDNDLKEYVTYTIQNPNVGYFAESATGTKLTQITGKDLANSSSYSLYLYDCFENMTLVITASVEGAESIDIIVNVKANLHKESSAVDTAKFITFANFDKTQGDQNVKIEYGGDNTSVSYIYTDSSDPANPVVTTNKIEGINKFAIDVANEEIIYASFADLLQITNIQTSADIAKKLVLTKLEYTDLIGEYMTVMAQVNRDQDNNLQNSVISLLDENNDNNPEIYIKLEGDVLTIHGNIYTNMRLYFEVDSIIGVNINLSTQELFYINIHPMLKLARASWVNKVYNSDYFIYNSSSTLFTNGTNLYDNTFSLSILTQLDNGTTQKNQVTNYESSVLMDNNSIDISVIDDGAISRNWKWKGIDIVSQYLNKVNQNYDSNSATNIGKVVYNTDSATVGRNVYVDNGILKTIPLPESIVLPLSLDFKGAFIGDVTTKLNVMIPVAGYNFLYKPDYSSTSYLSAKYNYNNYKFVNALATDMNPDMPIDISLTAGSRYFMTEYIKLEYANSSLEGLIDATSINNSINNQPNFVDVDEIKITSNGQEKLYGSLQSLVLQLFDVVDYANIEQEFNVQVRGYTLRFGNSENIYDFYNETINVSGSDVDKNAYISLKISIIPNIKFQFDANNSLVINNVIKATEGVTINRNDSLMAMIDSDNFQFDMSEYELQRVTTTSFVFAKKNTNIYLQFNFGDNAIIDTDTKAFNVTDATEVEYTLSVHSGENAYTFSTPFKLILA